MGAKSSISLLTGCIFLFTGLNAHAGGRDAAIGLGVGVGLGLLLNEMSKGGPRNPNDRMIGRVPEGGRKVKSQAQLAAEREQRQRETQEVTDVQTRLKALNFYSGSADGKTGPQTRAAISAFQQSLGQSGTGVLSPDQKSMLIASTTSQPTAPSATALQPLATSASALAPLGQNTQVSPQDPFANATSMLPEPGNLAAQDEPLSAVADTGNPSVLGVSPSMEADEAFTKLASVRDTEWCNRTASAIVCSASDAAFTDEVIVGITAPDDGARVHTVIRTTKFATAVARAAVEGKVHENYPALVAAPGSAVASGNSCAPAMQAFRSDDFSALKQWIVSGASPSPALASLAMACQNYGEVALPAGDTVPGFTIALFSGQPLQAALTEGEVGTLTPVAATAPDIRF